MQKYQFLNRNCKGIKLQHAPIWHFQYLQFCICQKWSWEHSIPSCISLWFYCVHMLLQKHYDIGIWIILIYESFAFETNTRSAPKYRSCADFPEWLAPVFPKLSQTGFCKSCYSIFVCLFFLFSEMKLQHSKRSLSCNLSKTTAWLQQNSY